jgi:hypothetical protein
LRGSLNSLLSLTHGVQSTTEMALLRQCIRRSPPTSTFNENDDIYPVHTLDDTKTLRKLLIAWTIYFNDALDVDRLRSSLARLLEIGDWRKIGGRLAFKVLSNHTILINGTDDCKPGKWIIRAPRAAQVHSRAASLFVQP